MLWLLAKYLMMIVIFNEVLGMAVVAHEVMIVFLFMSC